MGPTTETSNNKEHTEHERRETKMGDREVPRRAVGLEYSAIPRTRDQQDSAPKSAGRCSSGGQARAQSRRCEVTESETNVLISKLQASTALGRINLAEAQTLFARLVELGYVIAAPAAD